MDEEILLIKFCQCGCDIRVHGGGCVEAGGIGVADGDGTKIREPDQPRQFKVGSTIGLNGTGVSCDVPGACNGTVLVANYSDICG